MTTNFEFLKKVDKNLFTIISEAEYLYRDEYFEQCMVQTRRFAENICKNVLGSKRTTEKTFDDMLATLKDNITGEEQEKEFINDLYFLKKNGNISAHSNKVKQDGIIALECLQRAFEAAINYCVYFSNANSKILNLQYDIDLLVTGEKSKQSLADKYKSVKKINDKPQNTTKIKNNNRKNQEKQFYQMKTKNKTHQKPIFWYFVAISSFISIVLLILITIFV